MLGTNVFFLGATTNRYQENPYHTATGFFGFQDKFISINILYN